MDFTCHGAMTSSVGDRVKGLIRAAQPQLTQAAVAAQVEMTPDTLSRALNGSRGFAASELARVSEVFGISMYWLATGKEDPRRSLLAARHEYDHETGLHKRVDLEKSAEAREAIELVYQQGFPEPAELVPLRVRTPEEMRAALGSGFVIDFADRIERELEIDVLRFEGLHTALSLIVAGRRCIALQPSPNWFYQNWSLAHELGHLILGDQTDPEQVAASTESAANRFAAELLLPETEMRSIEWQTLQAEGLAELLWEWGSPRRPSGSD
ncbi:ImmA/IrrE family metallo-endopeptidase [Leucobacter sp. wl10]|nr:ImmA/IrrE family metallo-endopeptidase [Leucobacter sp. wl10]